MGLSRVLRPITHPVIADDRDLRRYVAFATAVAVLLALLLDIGNQLIFFVDWTTSLRSWILTAIDAGVIAVLISILIARAQRDLHRANRLVEELSRIDMLTGLPNRRAIMAEVVRREQAVLLLVIVDIDRFKSVNDTYGHRSGDAVLQGVAQRLAADLPAADLVGRLGGEEFAVLCAEPTIGAVLRGLEAFRDHMASHPLLVAGVAIRVTISAGAAIRRSGEAFDMLYTEADAALYQAKNGGRNRIVLSPSIDALHGENGRPRAVA